MPTFAELRANTLLLVIDTPTAVQQLVGSFVNSAIKRLQRRHNFKVMEASTTYTTTTLVRELGIRPGDWKQPRGKPYFIGELDGFAEIEYTASLGQALAYYGDNPDFDYGPPSAIFEDDATSSLLVFPYPDGLSTNSDGEYRVTVPYWRYLAPLSSDSDTNWFSENAEDYIQYRAASEAFFANEDEDRAAVWARRAEDEMRNIINTDKYRRAAEATTLVPYTGALMPHLTGRNY